MEKEKNILYFYFSENVTIAYDFTTSSFVNADNYIIICCAMSTYEQWIFYYLNRYQGIVPEWIFSYPELAKQSWGNACHSKKNWAQDLPKKIKKGYIAFCTENKYLIGNDSYNLFIMTSILNNNKKLITFSRKLNTNCYGLLTYDEMEKNPILYQNMLNTLFKIYMYSAMWCEFISFAKIAYMAQWIIHNNDWIELLDTNRGIDYNYNTLVQKRENEENKQLAQNLQKINAINNMIIGDYIIKIPQTIEDLIDEGKQQNNCVGYYYNEKVAQGSTQIYFIRKKDNPYKSYVTCRYEKSALCTVEHRYFNNRCECELDNIREQIDDIISKIVH